MICLFIHAVPAAFATETNTNPYEEMIISIMGDSISTFSTQPHSEKNRYPENAQGSGVDTVEDTWWMQLINELDAKLGICEARGSSTVTNIYDTITSDGRKGPTIAMASWERINDLDENGTPDVIIVYGGTNDKNAVYRDHLYEMGTFDPEKAPSFEDYDPTTDTAIKWNNVVEGFVAMILRMKATYPDAKIIALLPRNGSADNFNATIKPIYDHYGIPTVSLEDVPSTGIWDTLHPNAYGMDYITAKVKAAMLGESMKYPVYHEAVLREAPVGAYNDTNLWPETPDAGYYKGSIWNKKYPSVTLAVEEGDQVYASSFQDTTATGGTSDGIAVTFISEGAVKSSLSPAQVYSAFTEKGYVAVPAGVDAICIPMWKNDENAVVNLKSLPARPADEPTDDPSGGVTEELVTVTSVELNVTAPVVGKAPTTTISGESYTGAISWSPTVDETFVDGIPYTATVTLMANTGYQFGETVAGTINGEETEFTVTNGAVTGSIAFAAHEEPLNEHLWRLPNEGIYNTTNLWELAETEGKIAEGYYKNNGWTDHSSHFSITIPVEPGDRFFASSFQAKGINGHSSNDGIVLAYLYGDTITKYLGYADVYGEFEENGYLTVPNDIQVNAVNIVTWNTASVNPVVLLLDRPDDPNVNPNGSPTNNSSVNTPVEALPDEAYNTTNLWQYYKDAGKLVGGGYYSGSGVWTASSSYYNVTVAVEPGDHITTAALNGAGLVISFWYGDHFVIGYSKANANTAHDAHGYLTVPGGVNAVNIILAKTQSNPYFYIKNLPIEPIIGSTGDISTDGMIDENDYTILNRYLAGWNGYAEQIPSMEAADINNDGKVSTADATILARYLAGWDGYAEYFK